VGRDLPVRGESVEGVYSHLAHRVMAAVKCKGMCGHLCMVCLDTGQTARSGPGCYDHGIEIVVASTLGLGEQLRWVRGMRIVERRLECGVV